MKSFVFITFLFFTLIISAQETVVESRNVSPFSNIEVSQGVIVYLSQEGTTSLTVESEDNEEIINSIITEVRNDILKITVDDRYKKSKMKKTTMIIRVTTSTINRIVANAGSKLIITSDITSDNLTLEAVAGAEIEFQNKFIANNLNISIIDGGKISSFKALSTVENAKILASSSGQLFLNLKVDSNIDCSATSKATIEMNGSVNEGLLSATSSSIIKMKGVEFKRVNAVATTSSLIQLTVKDFLAATATNHAIINYWGKPKNISRGASTGGKIK